jgi:hypothetical protein
MKDISKSSFIFDLTDEFKILGLSDQRNEFTDEAFNLFCDKYKLLSKKRDTALFQYLNSTPNLFRSHLPHSKWAIAVAFNVVWYYDELIVSDPVLQLINFDKTTLLQKKNDLQQLLIFLKRCKESIDGGFLLFSGDNITPDKTGLFDADSNLLVNVPEVTDAFEKISLMVKKTSPINENLADNLTQLEVIYHGFWGEVRRMGMYIPPHVLDANKLGNGISYDFTTPYQRLTKDELINFNKVDMLESLKDEYSKDISIVLETITNAHRLNVPVLFYRNADRIAAKNYATSNNKQDINLFTDTTIYDCVLPYVDGIPAERLFDVRNQVPEVFKDFRAFLFELVMKTMKSTDNPAEFKFKIDNEISSMMRKLNVEMSNAKSKWRFQGVATPLIMLTSSLTLLSSGLDYSQLLSTFLGSGGLIQGLNTWSNVRIDEKKASLNPVYFLWKAQQ